MLGPLAMWAADGTPLDIRGVRLRGLLARLALSAGRPVSVETLVDGLWGSEAPSANALQSLVSRLRAGLPATESSISVQSGPAGYTLTIGPDCVDALQFEDLVRRGRALLTTEPEQAHALLTQADKLWRGEALTDLRDLPFAAVEADRLAELRLAAAEDLAEAAVTCGQARDLITDLEQLAVTHPLRERVHELLIRALYADGRQAEALAAYERVRTTLADELGADPGMRLRDLHVSVLRGDNVDPTAKTSVPTPAPSMPRSNLRAPMTSFVGRREDVAELTRLMSNGTRLVTMVGPGGAGKTRLATEAGRTLVEQSGDGIWFVELAPLGDAADVAPAVLSTLGASEYVDLQPASFAPKHIPTSRAATLRLVEVIGDRRILLVLDNCEHLILEVAGLVDSLLASCPRLRVLTTSREPLSIPGEHLHPVGPLGMPPEDEPTDDDYPAMQLFVDRARAVRPDFALIDKNRDAVAEICRRLDGMPLAIELAAARLRALTPPQIVDRLTDRFRLLTSGSRTALPRHQTLRAVVEWSWDLLDPDEQAVARRLSLFSGGATLDAAEQICSDDRIPPESVLGVLASLVDKSLVEAAADERSVRYRMLETVRAYGAEQLNASGEYDHFRRKHTAYFSRMLRRARPKLRTGEQIQWIARLTADNENLLDALRTAIDIGSARIAVQMVAVLGEYWTMSGRPAEAVNWMRAALAVPGKSAPLDKAEALYLLALGQMSSGEDPAKSFQQMIRGLATVRWMTRRHQVLIDAGIGLFTNAVWAAIRRDKATCFRELEAAGEHHDPWVRNMGVMMGAMFRENEGEVDQMAANLTVALDGFRQLGDRFGTSMALRGLASYQASTGDHAQALESLIEALQLIEELGTTEGVAQLLGGAAMSRIELGDIDGARADLERALRLSEETGSRGGQAMAYMGLARIAYRAGALDESRDLAERAYGMLDLEAERVAPHGQASMLAQLSRTNAATGDIELAQQRNRESVRLAITTEDMPLVASVVETSVDVDVAVGETEQAARTLGMATVLRGMRSVPDGDVQRSVDRLRDALGNERYDAAFAAGAALTRDEAIAELRKRFSSD
ncbi:BTAD domain-containing putative transcriptional regulator [Kribbella sp. NPDC058693]|uniref:BTAD domain-containing putative transcriptional regulator n=1 Tax=Kribbella sp. NPDC058693 TaxID=3346602 RepID=UPI003652F3E3